MKPSSEVGKASGEETEIGETMEGVVTTVDAMTSAVDTMEAMVMAIEMREWLEMGQTETERITAIQFFSRPPAVNCTCQQDHWHCSCPLYWPELLPGLVQLLADCLLPGNSKAIQSGAMLSLKYHVRTIGHPPVGSNFTHLVEFHREVNRHASDHLLRLMRETDCTEIRDHATWLLGRMAWVLINHPQWANGFLPLLIDLVRNYAAISEPTTDAEISSLNTAIKALTHVQRMVGSNTSHPQPSWKPHILEIFPLLIGIFQEPGKRKKAQIRVGEFLKAMARFLDGNFFLENGMIEMLLETVRVGKEPTAVLVKALQALYNFIPYNNGVVHVKKMLDMGALSVFHLVLKRPNDKFKKRTLWDSALDSLECIVRRQATQANLKAVLGQNGLVELVLDRALGMDLSEETRWHHHRTMYLLRSLTEQCSVSQMRGLMLKGPLFHLLSRYLNSEHLLCVLGSVELCLAKCSVGNRPILRRLLDSTGITDAVRRISLTDPQTHDQQLEKASACSILDTYLKNPLPPRTSHNLPAIIYTKNAPY